MGYLKYTFLALFGWGFWAIGSKLLTRYFNATSMTFWTSLSSIIILSAFVLIRKNLTVSNHIIWAIPVSIMSLVAILSFYKALSTGPSSVVISITNMYLVFPIIFGIVFLKEAVTLTKAIGFTLAVLATFFLSL
jgi:uncharacterized membrane protein